MLTGTPASFHSLIFGKKDLCFRCYQKMDASFFRWSVKGVPCMAIYPYENDVRSRLYQFKGCGDLELSPTFFSFIASFLKLRFRDYVVVPVPSTENHDQARGFNQVEEMAKELGLPVVSCLRKDGNEKQSDLSLKERSLVGRWIRLEGGLGLKGKKILLLDDVYTTGHTIKVCLAKLRSLHPKKMAVLTMAKTLKRSP